MVHGTNAVGVGAAASLILKTSSSNRQLCSQGTYTIETGVYLPQLQEKEQLARRDEGFSQMDIGRR